MVDDNFFLMMFFGRFIIGLAKGAYVVCIPQYSTEISEKEIRGLVGTFLAVLINSGVLFTYTIGAFLSVFWTSVTCAILPLVFALTFAFMPESPVYLVSEKRDDDAIKCYKWLRGSNYDPRGEIDELKKELEEIERRTKILFLMF